VSDKALLYPQKILSFLKNQLNRTIVFVSVSLKFFCSATGNVLLFIATMS